jgi:hypothetical protein
MFDQLFVKSKGKPIKYKDKTLFSVDFFPVPKEKCKLKINIVSTNSEWKQGIGLRFKKMDSLYLKI